MVKYIRVDVNDDHSQNDGTFDAVSPNTSNMSNNQLEQSENQLEKSEDQLEKSGNKSEQSRNKLGRGTFSGTFSSDRFSTWKAPQIEHGKLTQWNWLVQHPEHLMLGTKTDIGSFTYINAQYGVEIQDNVQIGSHCSVYSVSTIDNKKGKVTLKKNACIGSHSTIMPSITIGENSIIGAHSFVTRDIPDNVIAFGVPAKIIKTRAEKKKEEESMNNTTLNSVSTDSISENSVSMNSGSVSLETASKNKSELSKEESREESRKESLAIFSSTIIPLAKPHIDDDDIAAVTAVLKSGTLSLGPAVKEFEKNMADLLGMKYAVAVNSGTSGLHLVIRALGITEGDEVITSSFSFIASANCLLYEKATPVFVDVEEDTFNMDPLLIEKAITPKTKAILVPHIFGQSANMTKIMEIAKKHHLRVIEDACESLLATHQGKYAGSFGDAAVFAFYPNKQMTTGEGGMIVTNNEAVYSYCKSAANQGRSDDRQWLLHDKLGYNYRLDEMSAALGVTQLKKIPWLIKQRGKIAQIYQQLLANNNILNNKVLVPRIRAENVSSWFVFPIRVHETMRDKLIVQLQENGVSSKAYFYPCIHLQPLYRKLFGHKEGDFPVAETLSKTTLILPFYPQLAAEDIEGVVSAVLRCVAMLQHERK